jgi:DNA-binding response OmpR family regulator
MHILVVEQEVPTVRSLARGLERYDHEVRRVTTGAAALEQHEAADLVLLDLDLPDMDSLEVCRRIRRTSCTPVIAFNEPGTGLDRILSLQAGADDCLEKPFEFRELLARMEAVMRRVWPKETAARESTALTLGSLTIDAASREVRVDGAEVELTRKEFDLLHYLARNSKTVVTRQRLMAEVWEDPESHVLGARASRTLDTHVSSLRTKLGRSSWILNVRGVGFRVGHG